MKKFSKILALVLAVATLAVCCFSLAACNKGITDSTPDGIKKYGKLVVATNPYFPPFEYIDEDGQYAGWDMDLAKALANKLGVDLEIVSMEFTSVLAAPNTNKAHIAMAGISYSEKRDETLDFTMGVFDSTQVIIVKNDSTITGPFDLLGKTVGVQSGTVGEYLAEMDPDWAGEGADACLAAPASVKKFTTGAEAVADLIKGGCEAVIIDKYPAETFVAKNTGIKIAKDSVFDDEYAFAVAEGNKELVDWLNAAITELKADGTFDAINKKYFG